METETVAVASPADAHAAGSDPVEAAPVAAVKEAPAAVAENDELKVKVLSF